MYPVNPATVSVAGVRAYPSVLDVPDAVDLAIVVVPAAAVLDVVDECAQKRVHGLVVISAGFAEVGDERRGGASASSSRPRAATACASSARTASAS